MVRRKAHLKALQIAGASCCLLLAIGGCQFHRTGHGFIVRNQWSLELDTRCMSDEANCRVDPIRDNSEFLSWRNQRRGHPLVERLFHREESADVAGETETKTKTIQVPNVAAISRPEPRLPDLVNE